MESEIIDYFSNYVALSPKEIAIISQLDILKKVPKNTILLKEGEYAKHCYLVLRGCIRSFYLIDGEEKTTDFFTENQPVVPVSYNTGAPSSYYLETLEDCIVSEGSQQTSEILFKAVPKMEFINRLISEELIANKQVTFDDFKNSSPETRYLKLLSTQPDLITRVPQHQLASFLGIQPESLSRIRKRIREKTS